MSTDLNPYESPPPTPDDPSAEAPQDEESNVFTSVFLIIAGAFFCITSFYVVFGHGLESLVSAYRETQESEFAIIFMTFYGFTGGFTCLFHLSHLILGRPKQAIAGIYAIGLAVGITSIGVVIMKMFA